MRHLFKLAILFVVGCSFSPSIAIAQINGFGLFDGFSIRRGDSGDVPTIGDGFIQITNGFNQRRSVWFDTRQPIDTFSASFNYQATTGGSGLSFIIQDDSLGTFAVTNQTSGGGFRGINRSLGVVFTNSGSETFVSVLNNGSSGSGGTPVGISPGGSGFDVTLVYDGTRLTITINDGVNTPFTQINPIDPSIANSISSGDALIGFGAATGMFSSTNVQRISDFQFSSEAALIGDVSLDNSVNFLDISPFIALLSGGGYQLEADINRDGNVDFLDIPPFITILSN